MSAERKTGLRRASVRDFHSFRVTWITIALAAGVPMELVTRVTGHKTVDVVLKHYFRPGREEFRRAIEGAMPQMLTNGEGAGGGKMKTAKEQVLGICATLLKRGPSARSGQAWKKDVAQIVALVEGM